MKIFILFFISCISLAQAKTIVTFQKKGEKKVYSISLHSARRAYQAVSQVSLNTPSRDQFLRDYIRYHVALKEAYNDKSLVSSNSIQQLIVHPELKRSFDEALYKVYSALRLRAKLQSIESEVRNVSDKSLRSYYSSYPYFKFQFIVLNIPALANPQQIKNIESRSRNIYKRVKKDKKPFPRLIKLYSDNSNIGYTNNSYSRSSLYPLIYSTLKSLKPGQISQPIRTPNGFYILKLVEVVPFRKANKEDLKEQIYNTRTAKIFKRHFDQLLNNYIVQINETMIQSL